jgi:di/tripeptidase
VHNTRKNFTATEFKQLASSMLIKVKKVPVETYNSVRLVERYHALLRRAYKIIKKELKDEHINKEMILQMAVKAVNDLARPDGIVPILLVFGLYLRMTEIDLPLPIIAKRAEAICAVTKEVRRLHAKQQVSDALAIHNGLNTIATEELLL